MAGIAVIALGKIAFSYSALEQTNQVHNSGFYELGELIRAESNESSSLVGQENFAQVGITSHHLPTAQSFIGEFYQAVRASSGPRQTFVVIGPDHFERCRGEIATTDHDYITPFGLLALNREITDRLVETGAGVEPECLEGEHSIGVQALFIKLFFPEATIVPLTLSASTEDQLLERLTEMLSEYGDEIFVVASVDFSHYQTLEVAEETDAESLTMIANMNAAAMALKHADSPGSIRFAIMLAQMLSDTQPLILDHTNSYQFTNQKENTTGYINALFVRE